MPQADIGMINSTVFFLFVSFIAGYFVWVNFLFPRVVVSFRVKSFVSNLEQKDYSSDVALVERFSDKKTKALKFQSIFFIDPILALDLPSDEVVLLFNTTLVAAFFYFVSNKSLSDIHKSSRDFVLALSSFDFVEDLKTSLIYRDGMVKHLRSGLTYSVYKVYNLWEKNKNDFLFPFFSASYRLLGDELLAEISAKNASRKINKFNKFLDKTRRKSKVRFSKEVGFVNKSDVIYEIND